MQSNLSESNKLNLYYILHMAFKTITYLVWKYYLSKMQYYLYETFFLKQLSHLNLTIVRIIETYT